MKPNITTILATLNFQLQNVFNTTKKRRSFEQGKVYLPYSRFLGYERGEDGRPRVIKSEAEIIRKIFSEFLHGMTPTSIARNLEKQSILSLGGKEKWSVSTVKSILQNEKYVENALLQKTVGIDFLQKSHKKNEGEAPQYHVKESHQPIIRPEVIWYRMNFANGGVVVNLILANIRFQARLFVENLVVLMVLKHGVLRNTAIEAVSRFGNLTRSIVKKAG